MCPVAGGKALKGLTMQGSKGWVADIGIYIIIILAVARFVIYPLHGAIKDRRAAFNDQSETNGIKTRMLEQARQTPRGGVSQETGRMRSALYPREVAISTIQTNILMQLSALSEGQGMSVMGFEMPEAAPGKKIMEVPVVIRLKGRADSFLEVLKVIRKQEKVLIIKAMEVSATGQDMTFSLTIKALQFM
jgi:Type II secretion system (T2SS), protein M subtype b